MKNQSKTLKIGDWIIRMREPEGSGPHPVMLMLHGWTGDEESMWIFSQRLPKDALLIAPRGLYTTALGGYGWQPREVEGWPKVGDFKPAIEALQDLLVPANFPSADFSKFRLVGFSQGAALGYTLALFYPQQLRSFAGLSGFLPKGADALVQKTPLQGKPAFIAHGTQDEMVSVERARRAVEMLQQAGAQVTYCEDDVGHKLSLSCFKGLEAFFSRN